MCPELEDFEPLKEDNILGQKTVAAFDKLRQASPQKLRENLRQQYLPIEQNFKKQIV